jgi:AcrR family transcriptional regulator
MPKVTEAHLAARREQVLAAAWVCFARDGFHATSIADVIAESGLSAGAVYRYFRSKEELIGATTDRVLGVAMEGFREVLDAADPLAPAEALAEIVVRIEHLARQGPIDITRIGLHAWGEALRSPDVRTTAGTAQHTLRLAYAQYAGRCRDAGVLPATADPEEVAKVWLSLALGFLVQRLLVDDVDAAGYSAGLRAILPPGARSVT